MSVNLCVDHDRRLPSIRVLVVGDFEPFRRIVYSALCKRPQLQNVGQASNGFEAMRKTERPTTELDFLGYW